MSKLLKGYLLVVLAILAWGIAGPIAKLLFTKKFDSFIIIQTRATFSFLLLFFILFIFKRELLKIRGTDIKYFFILGVIGMAGSNYFYYTSIKYITVATAIMLQYTTPFIVLIYAFITKSEKVDFIKIFMLVLAFILLFFAISGGDLGYFSINLPGVILGLSSAITWAFFNIFNKEIKNRYNDWSELLYIIGSTSLLWFIINPGIFTQLGGFEISDIIILLGFAILSILIPMFCYNSGLKYLHATQATTIGLMEPVFVVFAAYFIINENITAVQAVCGAFVLIIIYFLEKLRKSREIEPLNIKYEN